VQFEVFVCTLYKQVTVMICVYLFAALILNSYFFLPETPLSFSTVERKGTRSFIYLFIFLYTPLVNSKIVQSVCRMCFHSMLLNVVSM